MRRRKDFGHLKLLALFLFVSVGIPAVLKVMSAGATGNLGDFEAGETGIKVCAVIANGFESSLRFHVSSNQGFNSDILVDNNSCKLIKTEAATYTVRHFVPQEYTLTSVTGGTVSADNTPFVATASGQYTIIYTDTYVNKKYLKTFGYTNSNTTATAVRVNFDANGGAGSMNAQNFGLNSQQPLTANAFTMTDYAFTGWNTKADGSGTGYTDEQPVAFAVGGEVTLYAQWEYNSRKAADVVARQENDLGDYTIDFTRKAVVSTDVTTANGNGVNKYTENNTDIYYYRGQIDNNNVIWANMCWKIIRTTATGGTKIIYNGTPVDVVVDNETVKQCTDTTGATWIAYSEWSRDHSSPADSGYMYGAAVGFRSVTPGNTVYVFSNDVSRNGNTYTLDTSAGQSISGTWADERLNSATRYHYFCTDGSAVCNNNTIGYIESYYYNNEIYYFSLNGYDDVEDLKEAMATNTNNSYVKSIVESWFEQQNLDGHEAGSRNYEDDLEDAVYCSDRSYGTGPLAGKDVDAGTSANLNGATARNRILNAQNNYSPSLDCSDTNDAFTKNIANGNGMLTHKVGLATLDEVTLAGMKVYGDGQPAAPENYLNNGQEAWTMSPDGFNIASAHVTNWHTGNTGQFVEHTYGIRPVVSLNSNIEFASGTGLATDPYIVE